jgi:hypothetical protein
MRTFYYIIGIFSSLFLANITSLKQNEREDCLSVSSGGISGYWYSAAKIKEMNFNGEYFCASSGCLSIISKDIHFNKLLHLAIKAKKLHTFSRVKNRFISDLVNNIDKVPNMTVVTMSNYGSCIQRKPRDKLQLLALLITTTDVPFISNRASKEMDGGICLWMSNPCKNKVKFPFDYRFIFNTFNIRLKLPDVNYFYKYKD